MTKKTSSQVTPEDMWRLIADFSAPKDWATLARIDKSLRPIIKNEREVWREKFKALPTRVFRHCGTPSAHDLSSVPTVDVTISDGPDVRASTIVAWHNEVTETVRAENTPSINFYQYSLLTNDSSKFYDWLPMAQVRFSGQPPINCHLASLARDNPQFHQALLKFIHENSPSAPHELSSNLSQRPLPTIILDALITAYRVETAFPTKNFSVMCETLAVCFPEPVPTLEFMREFRENLLAQPLDVQSTFQKILDPRHSYSDEKGTQYLVPTPVRAMLRSLDFLLNERVDAGTKMRIKQCCHRIVQIARDLSATKPSSPFFRGMFSPASTPLIDQLYKTICPDYNLNFNPTPQAAHEPTATALRP